MPTIAQTIETTGGGVIHFLKWWREELGGLLPQRVAGRSAAKIIVCVGPEGYRLLEGGGGKLRPVRGGADLSALDAVAAASELARANPAAEVGIRVPLASCFVRTVELPRSGVDPDELRRSPEYTRCSLSVSGIFVVPVAVAPGGR